MFRININRRTTCLLIRSSRVSYKISTRLTNNQILILVRTFHSLVTIWILCANSKTSTRPKNISCTCLQSCYYSAHAQCIYSNCLWWFEFGSSFSLRTIDFPVLWCLSWLLHLASSHSHLTAFTLKTTGALLAPLPPHTRGRFLVTRTSMRPSIKIIYQGNHIRFFQAISYN